MSQFDFITDESFRKSLESDANEITLCMATEAWKAAQVIAGSIVETLLIDYLVSENVVSRDEALKMDFGHALNLCKEKKIISSKTADLSSVVKDYRNLIHPGRLIRLNETVDQSTAEVAQALVAIVSKEIEKRKRENYGYTAEQIISKLERDSSAEVIVSHLLKRTKPVEIARLLKILPNNYGRVLQDDTPAYALNAFVVCFRTAFDQVTDDLKIVAMENFAKIFREEGDDVIYTFIIPFLRARDLKYIPQEDVDLIKQHLLERLKSNSSEHVLNALDGIGRLVNKQECYQFTDSLIRIVCRSADPTMRNKASQIIVDEWANMSSEIDGCVTARLNAWIDMYKSRGNEELTERLEAIQTTIINYIPL